MAARHTGDQGNGKSHSQTDQQEEQGGNTVKRKTPAQALAQAMLNTVHGILNHTVTPKRGSAAARATMAVCRVAESHDLIDALLDPAPKEEQ